MSINTANQPAEIEQIQQFFAAISTLVARTELQQQELDRTEATHFNVFELIEPDENKLSDILVDLLNPTGNHGQGHTFLRLLVEQVNLDSRDTDLAKARVQREVATYGIIKFKRRIDVLVDADILIAIENKVDAMEQPEQIKDYFEHLVYSTRITQKPFALIYLTPEGCPPMSFTPGRAAAAKATGRLYCWSYQRELRVWLENCRKQCAAPKIACFLADFIRYIDSTMRHEPEAAEAE